MDKVRVAAIAVARRVCSRVRPIVAPEDRWLKVLAAAHQGGADWRATLPSPSPEVIADSSPCAIAGRASRMSGVLHVVILP
jgi:hypothetical protein